jgi:hypothetical protein
MCIAISMFPYEFSEANRQVFSATLHVEECCSNLGAFRGYKYPMNSWYAAEHQALLSSQT